MQIKSLEDQVAQQSKEISEQAEKLSESVAERDLSTKQLMQKEAELKQSYEAQLSELTQLSHSSVHEKNQDIERLK